MSSRRPFDWTTAAAYVIVTLIFVAIAVIVFLIRLWITGGDVGCVFSQDPALCVSVKGI